MALEFERLMVDISRCIPVVPELWAINATLFCTFSIVPVNGYGLDSCATMSANEGIPTLTT